MIIPFTMHRVLAQITVKPLPPSLRGGHDEILKGAGLLLFAIGERHESVGDTHLMADEAVLNQTPAASSHVAVELLTRPDGRNYSP
jgi:hypothetical protein